MQQRTGVKIEEGCRFYDFSHGIFFRLFKNDLIAKQIKFGNLQSQKLYKELRIQLNLIIKNCLGWRNKKSSLGTFRQII